MSQNVATHRDRTTTAVSDAPEPGGAGAARIQAAAAVKEFVHRAAADDVLLTGWQRQDATRFTLDASWPAGHRFYAALHGRHAPTLIAETLRQAAMLLAHTEFAVPVGHAFLMWDLNYTAHPELLRTGPGNLPLKLDFTCSKIRRRGVQLASMTCQLTIRRAGEVIATGGGSLTCTTPAAYRRLRQGRLAARPPAPGAAVPPQTVNRTGTTDVVLGPAPGRLRWQLRADPAHRTMFDHTGDHIPGMVLLEAAHQAAYATASGDFYPTSVTISYNRYAEFDTPCWIQARTVPAPTPGALAVLVTCLQDDQRVFNALLEGIPGRPRPLGAEPR
ncbi:ScbA/BarX family gamma-butyrolactone biosynthesis protein [Streptomyces beijiangensis]|uniref:A-factor biosynthesis hotdog domain-containing protein n=1 Tax=Streptomyces beijiangensis TaxID=163361 RepID=A0A939FFJ5_9ACTN|nr:ScbA/BarX family gamma-butyrolactone biosynthesis protein [Streptomyces beijiangensis]MBO0516477.1 hypothetical protein [Streptomyces beijiangensis]